MILRDSFTSSVPAWKWPRLRAALRDAEHRGRLGDPLEPDSHRALVLRWHQGNDGAAGRVAAPHGALDRMTVRTLQKLRHALTAAGATPDQASAIDQAIAAIVGIARDLATAPAGRRWKPPTRGKGKQRHVAAGRRAELVDEAVQLALPAWRDGLALERGDIKAVYDAAKVTCNREGFPRPSYNKIRAWLNRRSKTPLGD
jgi:hypothetical protein